MLKSAILPLALFFLFLSTFTHCITISDVSVLLPWSSSGYTLYVNSTSGACIEWSTDAPHLIQMQYEACSNELKVIPISGIMHDLGEKKVSAIITARDADHRVQCEVYLGQLHRIEMLTSARKLYLGEVETLDIIGFDEEGNSFKTLNGLQFDWKTEKLTNKLKDGAIRLLPLNDATVRLSVDPTKTHNNFDSSQTIICQGLEIGQAKVVVSSRTHSHIRDEVDFSVFDKFSLRPSAFLRLIPTSVLTYQLYRQDRNKEMIHVPMPNSRYVWSTSETKVATIDSRIGTLHAKDLGMSSVIVKDTSFELNQAKGSILVVNPVRIAFKFKPIAPASLYEGYDEIKKLFSDSSSEGRNLVDKVDYEVSVELFDEKDNQIHITDNIQFEVTVDDSTEQRVEILNKAKNMQKFTLRTRNVGQASLRAKLIAEAGRRYPLSYSQLVNVYPRVAIAFAGQHINLPATPYIQQKFKVNAEGGSRRYKWAILNPTVASVDAHGVIISKFQGEVPVYVFDAENVFNGDVRVVRVSPPHALQWAPGKRETHTGSYLCLKLELHDAAGNAFAAFDAFKVNFKIGDCNIYAEENKKMCGDASNVYEVHAKRTGYTTIEARLASAGDMKDEIPVVVYEPLRTRIPRNDVNPIVIALGSTQPVVLEGGPVEWETYQLYRSSSVAVSVKNHKLQETIPVIRDENSPKLMAFTVTCRNLGERQVSFVVTNTIHVRGAEKTTETLTRKVICANPESMKLTPHTAIDVENRFASTPMLPIDTNARLLAYHVSTNSSIILKIDLFDKDGNVFSSFDSLNKFWHLSNELAHFPDEIVTYDGKRYLVLGSTEGLVVSHSKVNNYNPQTFKKVGVVIPAPKVALTSPDIQLRLSVPMRVSPQKLLLFNHPSITGQFLIHGGSGDFSVKSSPSFVASHEVSGNTIMVTPKAEGDTSLTIHDKRFESHPSVKALVSVADVAQIEIEGPQYVELGDTIKLHLRTFDRNGREFDRSHMSAMQPTLSTHSASKSRIIDIAEKQPYLFKVTGTQVGTIDVIASVVNADMRIVRSQPFQIHVFPPVYVEPPTLVLIPGAKYQVRLMGGPSLSDKQAHLSTSHDIISSTVDKNLVPKSYRGDSTSVITVDRRGVVTAVKYGKAVIELKRNIGGHQFASKQVEVYVLRLSSLRFSNSLSMYDDSRLPVQFHAHSTEGFPVGALSVQSPFFSLSYQIEDTDVVRGVQPTSTHGHVSVFEALRPGQAKINFVARFVHPHLEGYRLEEQVIIHVGERLKLVDSCTSKIIIPPSSTYKVKVNRDSARFFIQPTSDNQIGQILVGETSGKLKSSANEGAAILQIRDALTGQAIATRVEVDTPEYLSMDIASHILMLPLGSTRSVRFFGLNKHAETMSTLGSVQVAVKSNMYEHLDVKLDENAETLHIHALTTGNTTIQLYSPTINHTFDFKVVVVSTIRPSHPVLLVGDKLQFHLAADNEKQGLWKSTDASTLKVDPISGLAVAQAPGSTQVHYNSDTMSTSSQVEVRKISSALLSTSKKHLLIPLREKSDLIFKIPVAFYDQDREYISLDVADTPYRSLNRKLSVDCQSSNSIVRVVKSEQVRDKIICTVQQNFAAVASITEPHMETVRLVLQITNSVDSYIIQSDPFFVNLTDAPLRSVVDSGMYLEGESISSQVFTQPDIMSRLVSLRGFTSQVIILLFTILISVLIYKFFTACAQKLTGGASGARGTRNRGAPVHQSADVNFTNTGSQLVDNGMFR